MYLIIVSVGRQWLGIRYKVQSKLAVQQNPIKQILAALPSIKSSLDSLEYMLNLCTKSTNLK